MAGHFDEFTTLMKVYKEDPILIAKMITIWRSEFSKKMKKSLEEIEGIFSEAILRLKNLRNFQRVRMHLF